MERTIMLMDQLKTYTADAHRRTESAFDLMAACQSKVTYVELLRKMLSLHQPLEHQLDQVDWRAAGLDDWPTRRKSHLLVADLAVLGEEVEPLEASTKLPIHSSAEALGVLYVLEGSTLGGMFIRKHVARTLGYDAATGCAFFNGYGDATTTMWKRFNETANAFGAAHPTQVESACVAALNTFACFEDTLRRSAAC